MTEFTHVITQVRRCNIEEENARRDIFQSNMFASLCERHGIVLRVKNLKSSKKDEKLYVEKRETDFEIVVIVEETSDTEIE